MEETRITLEEATKALIFGSFWILASSFIAWANGFYQMPAVIQEKKLSGNVLISAFVIFLLFSVAIGPLVSALGVYLYTGELKTDSQIANILISSLSILLTFFAIVCFYFYLTSEDKILIAGRYFGPLTGFKKTWNDLFVGIGTWFVAFPIMAVAGKLVYLFLYSFGLEEVPNQTAVSHVKDALESPALFSFIAIDIVFFVPILEEFIFRGCLQTYLKSRIGMIKAIVLASMIFAAFHFSFAQGLGNIELLVSLFILSCFLGFIYEKQKSLLASISLHAFFNAVTVALILLFKD